MKGDSFYRLEACQGILVNLTYQYKVPCQHNIW